MSTEQQRQMAPRRYLSRLTRGTLAIVMAGGRGERLKQLTEDRCKPAQKRGNSSQSSQLAAQRPVASLVKATARPSPYCH